MASVVPMVATQLQELSDRLAAAGPGGAAALPTVEQWVAWHGNVRTKDRATGGAAGLGGG